MQSAFDLKLKGSTRCVFLLWLCGEGFAPCAFSSLNKARMPTKGGRHNDSELCQAVTLP